MIRSKILSPQHITAYIIKDGIQHVVPVEHRFGNYFFAEVSGHWYLFSMKNAQILGYRYLAARAIQIIRYRLTDDDKPIDEYTGTLNLIFKKRFKSLPKTIMDKISSISTIYNYLANDIATLREEIKLYAKDDYDIEKLDIVLESIKDEDVVLPTPKISEVVADSIPRNRPEKHGESIKRDIDKELAQDVLDGSGGVFGKKGGAPTLMIIFIVIVAAGIGIMYMIDPGAFDNLLPGVSLSGMFGGGSSIMGGSTASTAGGEGVSCNVELLQSRPIIDTIVADIAGEFTCEYESVNVAGVSALAMMRTISDDEIRSALRTSGKVAPNDIESSVQDWRAKIGPYVDTG